MKYFLQKVKASVSCQIFCWKKWFSIHRHTYNVQFEDPDVCARGVCCTAFIYCSVLHGRGCNLQRTRTVVDGVFYIVQRDGHTVDKPRYFGVRETCYVTVEHHGLAGQNVVWLERFCDIRSDCQKEKIQCKNSVSKWDETAKCREKIEDRFRSGSWKWG